MKLLGGDWIGILDLLWLRSINKEGIYPPIYIIYLIYNSGKIINSGVRCLTHLEADF